MIKKAMIMAAGIGSRLGALSDSTPKPMVPLAGVPAIDIILEHLAASGIKNVIANTYFKAEQLQEHCKNNKSGVNFNYIQETELSGTAGGLGKCRKFFEDAEDFIVMSGDGLSDIDIEAAYKSHKKSNAIATITAKEIEHKEVSKYGIIVTDEKGFVKSFQEKPPINEALSNLANTGIYIFKREIFNYIPQNTFYDFAKNVFPALMKDNQKINTCIHKGYWSDIGSIEQYKQSNFDILNGVIPSIKVKAMHKGGYIKGTGAVIDNSAAIENCCIGNCCFIGKNTVIKNSILWDNIKVLDNVKIENSIILSGAVISETIKNAVISGSLMPAGA